MDVQDLSQNLRLASLTTLMGELAHSPTPAQTLQALRRGLSQTYGLAASLLLSTRALSEGQYRVIQMQREGQGPGNSLPWAANESGPVQSGGIVAAIIARREPQLIQNVDWSSDPFFRDALSGYASVMAIPIPGEHLPMTWLILLRRLPNQFSVIDLEETLLRVVLGGSLLESQVLAEQLARANERIDHDARQVGQLQCALLPTEFPPNAGLEIAVSYKPSGRAGGDLYDFFALDEPENDQANDNPIPLRWCALVGDAAGHGLAAAVVMAIVQSVLHAHPTGITGPAKLLEHANRQLCRKKMRGFFTAFLGIYETISRRLIYANAGHPPPLLRRGSDASMCPLDAVATHPLGIEASQTFEEAGVQLEPADTLLLYTDGITEARGTQGEQFEQTRLARAFRDGGDRPAQIVEHLRQAVRIHEEGQMPRDDQTLVAARVV
jgi:sigma-B regulation protein RsbU (phosphoserine phosphatase)